MTPRVITARQTRLVRVADLYAFHRAIARHACAGDAATVRSAAVIVGTEAAGDQLRSTLENLVLPGAAGAQPVAAWPEILSRAGWYDCLHHASPSAPRQLGAIEREVLMTRAAREAIAAGCRPPFHVRPPLVAEMLRFLDTMLRLGRTVDAFERLTGEELEPRVAIDRGAERLLRQTRFLVASFRRYAQMVSTSGALDEHLLRAHLLAQPARPPFRRVVVTVGDRSCGADGLWPADFDVLARLPHLDRVDIIATENVLAAGLHERLLDLLPGLEEIEFGHAAALAAREPLLAVPAGAETSWWVSRDREEELASIARRIKARFTSSEVRPPAGSGRGELVEPRTSDLGRAARPNLDRVAIVFKRPLPYLYLAQSHLAAAGIPIQAFDALPLAAEPFAAALDVVLRFVESGFARRHAVALLRSPHFAFAGLRGRHAAEAGSHEDAIAAREAVNALEAALREAGDDADPTTLERLIACWSAPEARSMQRVAVPAAVAALAAARELEPLRHRQLASVRFDTLHGFLEAHAPADDATGTGERATRARAAVLGAMREFAAAHRCHDDPAVDFDQFVSTLRQWIEAQTFSPRTGRGGLHLLDADAARYGDFDEVHIVGVVEREWPDTEGRTIFYPLSLLNQLGWPPERLRLAAARAAFRDLLRLAGDRVSVSTFILEDDALVEGSPLLDEVDRSLLRTVAEALPGTLRTAPEDALSLEPVRVDVLAASARQWAELRQTRSGPDERQYHGLADPSAVETLAVRRIEMYVDCPFRYFAEALLGLRDESDDDPAEGPRAQGKFLHDVLAAFFDSWQEAGHGAITPDTIEMARDAFRQVVETKVSGMRGAEAALWRTRLIGSIARPGVGEAVLRTEAASGDDVVRRLLEYRLEGRCHLRSAAKPAEDAGQRPSAGTGDEDAMTAAPAADPCERVVNLRGIADRIDVLSGKRFRIFDYKLGHAPDVRRAVQLPLYAVQATAHFASLGHRETVAAGAAYLAFGERNPHVPLAARHTGFDQAVAEGQERALRAIHGIERGWFPPQPAQPFMCSHCPYAGLCRKDYVDGDQ